MKSKSGEETVVVTAPSSVIARLPTGNTSTVSDSKTPSTGVHLRSIKEIPLELKEVLLKEANAQKSTFFESKSTSSSPILVASPSIESENLKSVGVVKENIATQLERIKTPTELKSGYIVGGTKVAELKAEKKARNMISFEIDPPDFTPGPYLAVEVAKNIVEDENGNMTVECKRIGGCKTLKELEHISDFDTKTCYNEYEDTRELLDFEVDIQPTWSIWNLLVKILRTFLMVIIPKVYHSMLIFIMIMLLIIFGEYWFIALLPNILLYYWVWDLEMKDLEQTCLSIFYYIIYILDRSNNQASDRRTRTDMYVEKHFDTHVQVAAISDGSHYRIAYSDGRIEQRDTESYLIPGVRGDLPIMNFQVDIENELTSRTHYFLVSPPIVQWVVGKYKTRDEFKNSAYLGITQRVNRFHLSPSITAELIKGTFNVANYYHLKLFNSMLSCGPLNY